jgi:hypothetical protein
MVGAWLNEDGEVEAINDLQNLKLGAWLDEENEVHTVNDLQNLNIGAWMGEDGDVHTVNDLQLQNLFGRAEVAQITKGLLSGALQTNGLDDYASCVQDSATVLNDFNSAVTNFSKRSIRGVTAGITNLAAAVNIITDAVTTCGQSDDIDQLRKLRAMTAAFYSPRSFAYNVGSNLYYNGVNIYHEVNSALAHYRAGKYEGFGADVGAVLALTLGGQLEQEAQLQNLQQKRHAKKLQVLLI